MSNEKFIMNKVGVNKLDTCEATFKMLCTLLFNKKKKNQIQNLLQIQSLKIL